MNSNLDALINIFNRRPARRAQWSSLPHLLTLSVLASFFSAFCVLTALPHRTCLYSMTEASIRSVNVFLLRSNNDMYF